jgi:hypothetical protein
MNGQVRSHLVDAIARAYSINQLDVFVHKVLNQPLEYYVSITDRVTTVDKLIEELERMPDDCEKFLVKLRIWTSLPEVRASIDRYYGVPDAPDPYEELVVLDEPFVNRQITRNKLRDLFQKPNRRAMVVRGPRASGKTYSRWLIEHVARSETIEPVYVELKDASLEEIVAQIINDLNLPPNEFRDRLAQFSTMAKGFNSALRGAARQMPAGQRWCLIFDSHDHDAVPNTTRDFVDVLLWEVARLQMPPIWMVVLGHRAAPQIAGPAVAPVNLMSDDILQVTQPDIDKYLQQLAAKAGQTLPPEKLTVYTAAIFNGLTPPFDHEGMTTLSGRLREKVAEIGAV